MYQVLSYKITDHRNLIPGFSPNTPPSTYRILFSGINQPSVLEYISIINRNNPVILRNKLFTPYNNSIIKRNKSIISKYKTIIPEYISKIFGGAFVFLRNKPVISENNSTTLRIGIFLFWTKPLFRLIHPLPPGR